MQFELIAQVELIAQGYGMAYAIVFLCIFLGLLLIGVPRPRAQYKTAQEKISGRMKKVRRKRPAVEPKAMTVAQQRALAQQQAGQRPAPQQRPAPKQPAPQPRPPQNPQPPRQ